MLSSCYQAVRQLDTDKYASEMDAEQQIIRAYFPS